MGAGVADGDKGDITVSGSGAVWAIDNADVVEIVDVVTDAEKIEALWEKQAGNSTKFDAIQAKRIKVTKWTGYNLSFSITTMSQWKYLELR